MALSPRLGGRRAHIPRSSAVDCRLHRYRKNADLPIGRQVIGEIFVRAVIVRKVPAHY